MKDKDGEVERGGETEGRSEREVIWPTGPSDLIFMSDPVTVSRSNFQTAGSFMVHTSWTTISIEEFRHQALIFSTLQHYSIMDEWIDANCRFHMSY